MADTEIEISGRVDRFEAALAKANAEVLKLKDALRQAAITGKQGNQDVAKSAEGAAGVMHRWGQQQIGSLAGMAAGYLTVTAAIGAVSSAYEEWNARMEKTHAKAKSFSDALAGGLFQAAAMEKMPGLKKWIEQGITGGRMLGTRLQRLEAVTPQAIAQRAGAIRADVGGDIWAREITSPAALQRVEGRTMKLREDQADIRDQQKAEDATRLSDERALERRDRTWYANVAVRAGIWAKWMTTTDTHGMDNVTEEIQKGNRLLRARQATDAALHAVTNSHD